MYYRYKKDSLFKQHFINNPVKKSTVILASYPKSGNTFFRFVWMNIISILELDGREIDFEILDNHLPYEGFLGDLMNPWEFKTLPCLLKTHENYSDKYQNFTIIHLFRNPLDTMISNYFYYSRRIGVPKDNFSWLEYKILNSPYNRFKGDFFDFLTEYFNDYCIHFLSYVRAFNKRQKVIPVSYEMLISEKATDFFVELFNKLNINIDAEVIIKAIEKSQPTNLKNKPHSKKMALLEKMHFIRNGSVGQYKDVFGSRELEFIFRKLRYYKINPKFLPDEYRQYLIEWPEL